MQTLTFHDDADTVTVSKIKTKLAKLKPACTRCGRNLAVADAANGSR
jgi:uncharacterized protein (DUF983 family)